MESAGILLQEMRWTVMVAYTKVKAVEIKEVKPLKRYSGGEHNEWINLIWGMEMRDRTVARIALKSQADTTR